MCRERSCSGPAPTSLSRCGWGGRSALLSSLERRDRLYVDRLRDRAVVALWFEHDLYDQLHLLDEAAAAWDAFRAPEPSALAGRARDASELPFLGAALRRLL
jgi:hypothetical protein